MKPNIKWLERNHLLAVDLAGELDNISFMRMDEAICQHLSQAPTEQVHIVFNSDQLLKIPDTEVYRNARFVHQNKLGWGVVCGISELGRFFTMNFMENHDVYFHLCGTFMEGLEFLTMMDPRLHLKTGPGTLRALWT